MKYSIEIRKAKKNDAQILKKIDTIVPIDPQRAVSIDKWLSSDIVLVAEIKKYV